MTSPTRATAATAATTAEAPSRGLRPAAAWLLSVACGLAVANVYYSQPLLDLIAADYGIDPATIGLVGTLTQTGYALGLLLLVPLGDRVNRRTLTTAQLGLSVLALAAVALAPSALLMLAAMAAVGVLAVVAQVVVAYAASLAAPADRGRVVGTVTSGIVVGILLARTVAGTIGDLAAGAPSTWCPPSPPARWPSPSRSSSRPNATDRRRRPSRPSRPRRPHGSATPG